MKKGFRLQLVLLMVVLLVVGMLAKLSYRPLNICPKCGSHEVLPIIYGLSGSMPSGIIDWNGVQVKIAAYNMDADDQTTIYCNRCRFEWVGKWETYFPKSTLEKLRQPNRRVKLN